MTKKGYGSTQDVIDGPHCRYVRVCNMYILHMWTVLYILQFTNFGNYVNKYKENTRKKSFFWQLSRKLIDWNWKDERHEKKEEKLHCAVHTDLIVSKKSMLRQNRLQLNKNRLEFIVRYSPSPLLPKFKYLNTFSCIFCKKNWQKRKNYQKSFSC